MSSRPNRVSTGQKLSLLWLFAILNILFRDIHELTTASAVQEILTGYMNGVEMTETVLIIGALLVELLLVAFLFSSLLPRRPSRMLNLALAPLAIVGTIAAGPGDPDDFIFAGVEVATYLVIFAIAWRWTPEAVHGARTSVTP